MRRTILLADDDALFRTAVADGLRAAGYEVVVAANGLETLELIREAPPDVILLDLIMPELDGIRVCKLLKRHLQYRAIPVIILTGLGPDGRKAAEGLEAAATVTKQQAEATLQEILNVLHPLETRPPGPHRPPDAAPVMAERRIVGELLAERQHVQALLETLGDGLVELDDKGRVLYVNPAGLGMLARTEEESIGAPGAEILGAANARVLQEGLHRAREGADGGAVRLELSRGGRIIGVTLTALRRPEGPPGALFVLRDLTDISRRARSLQAIRAVAEEITRELDLNVLLGLIQRRAAELVGAVSSTLYLWDEATQILAPAAWHGLGEWVREFRVRLGEGVAGAVAQRRQGMIVNEYRTSPHAHPWFVQHSRMTAAMAEPLLYRGRLVGVIAVNHEGGEGRFTEQDRELLGLFAAQAAIAIENARLYGEAQHRASEIAAIHEAGQAITGSLNLNATLGQIAESARRLSGAERAQIWMVDPADRSLEAAIAVGPGVEAFLGTRLPADGPAASARVVREGRPLSVRDTSDPGSADPALSARLGNRALLAVPLSLRETILGVLTVGYDRPRTFAPTEVDRLAGLAQQAAIAIENARLYGEVKDARDFLQSIAANSTDGIVTTDPGGRLTYVSPGAEGIVGYRAEELLGRPMASLYLGGADEARAIMQRLQAEPRIRNYETALRAKDGRWLEVSMSISLLLDGRGGTVGTLAIARDITERKRAEEELRKLSRAVEQSPTSIIITDTAGRIEYVNPKFTQVTGYTPNEVIGQNPRILKSGETPEEEYRQLWDTITSGNEWRGEFQNRKKDGTLFWEAASISPIKTRHGTITHFLAVKEDITERKRAQEQLRQSERLATMGGLLAGVAHELNNPLAIVMGEASLLAAKAGPGPFADAAKKIMDAAQRCARIVRNFLTLARQRPPEREKVWLNEVVRGAAELLAYPLRVDTVMVTLDLAPDLPYLWADPHQLHQVLVNLITNAHHAMHATPPPRRLTLATRYDPARRRVLLEVADTGPGIAPAVQARIFEPFFTTKPIGQGTGMGLSLCRGIIEGHGGSIRVESLAGGGTVFQVELPAEAAPPPAAMTPPAEAPMPTRGRTILVVEDEALIAELLTDVLSAEGHQVEIAANGTEAVDRLRDRTYDLILSDLRMPEMDGPSFYREVARSRPDLRGRFIFITGDLLSPETREFLEQTGAPSLSKPFAPEVVCRLIQEALRTG